jgi:hypothetical protein
MRDGKIAKNSLGKYVYSDKLQSKLFMQIHHRRHAGQPNLYFSSPHSSMGYNLNNNSLVSLYYYYCPYILVPPQFQSMSACINYAGKISTELDTLHRGMTLTSNVVIQLLKPINYKNNSFK